MGDQAACPVGDAGDLSREVLVEADQHGPLRKADRRGLVELIRPNAPRMARRLIDDAFDALDEQTIVLPDTGTLDIVIPSLARSLARRRP